jgi:hypothetical protein
VLWFLHQNTTRVSVHVFPESSLNTAQAHIPTLPPI